MENFSIKLFRRVLGNYLKMNYLHSYIKKNYPTLFGIVKKSKKKYIKIKSIFIYFFFFPPAYVLSKLKIDLLTVNVARIGHLTFDSEAYIKERILNDDKYVKPVMLAPYGGVANNEFLKYLLPYIHIVQNRFLCFLLRPLFSHPLCSVNSSRWGEERGTFRSFEIDARWEIEGRKGLSKLLPEHIAEGSKTLKLLGIPENSWFVCIHNRESGYSKNNHDFDQSFRNSQIANYDLAINEIIRRGGWCIRMGDPTMEPISPRQGLIDYAHSPYRSEVMDIYLCASARAFLGSSSGLSLLATYFNVPVGAANLIPLANSIMQGRNNLTIPKLITFKNHELVPFSHVLNSPVGSFRTSSEFLSSQYSYQDNTPEEILDLLEELLGDFETSNDQTYDHLQKKFRKLIEPHHWCYYGSGKIGAKFLFKYRELL
ncbi:TIGR04372 family glycosyltransferase [Polynucleobacter sp. MWH-UH23A]|uniref:TIGR04372 family glycosyltransferase n=1 Tax=Polynucleobacter sp. MWH-UH23A TaxID=1855613 RepID=UPI003364E806